MGAVSGSGRSYIVSMDDKPAIASPCILVCAIEPVSGFCYGCGRTRQEIGDWASYSDDHRTDLMAILPERVAGLQRRPRRVTKRTRLRQAAPAENG